MGGVEAWVLQPRLHGNHCLFRYGCIPPGVPSSSAVCTFRTDLIRLGWADRWPSHQLNSIFHHGALIYLDAGGVTRLLGAILNFAVYGPDAMIDPIHTMPYN